MLVAWGWPSVINTCIVPFYLYGSACSNVNPTFLLVMAWPAQILLGVPWFCYDMACIIARPVLAFISSLCIANMDHCVCPGRGNPTLAWSALALLLMICAFPLECPMHFPLYIALCVSACESYVWHNVWDRLPCPALYTLLWMLCVSYILVTTLRVAYCFGGRWSWRMVWVLPWEYAHALVIAFALIAMLCIAYLRWLCNMVWSMRCYCILL